jgi:hypothetical protein
MKKSIMAISSALLLGGCIQPKKITFEEYNLWQFCIMTCPSSLSSVIYHVGSKMKIRKNRICHFRTLTFEGAANIKRGEWFKIVTSNGGTNITLRMTEPIIMIFPSNNLELALWMESERLMHPVINHEVDTQNGS